MRHFLAFEINGAMELKASWSGALGSDIMDRYYCMLLRQYTL